MNPDFVFLVSYECPRCHAALEARSGVVASWMRCPACDRASLPPEPTRNPSPGPKDHEPLMGSFTTVPTALPLRPRPMAPMPGAPIFHAQTNRVLLGSGFFLSMFLTLFSLIESNPARSAVFGLVSALLLFFLSRPVAPGRR